MVIGLFCLWVLATAVRCIDAGLVKDDDLKTAQHRCTHVKSTSDDRHTQTEDSENGDEQIGVSNEVQRKQRSSE